MYLALHQPQHFFHLRTADLCVANCGLNGRCAARSHMPKVIGDLFKGPSCRTRAVGKIMPQVMEGQVRDKFPLLMGSPLLQGPKPVVNAILSKARAPLRGEYVGTGRIASAMLEIDCTGLAQLFVH